MGTQAKAAEQWQPKLELVSPTRIAIATVEMGATLAALYLSGNSDTGQLAKIAPAGDIQYGTVMQSHMFTQALLKEWEQLSPAGVDLSDVTKQIQQFVHDNYLGFSPTVGGMIVQATHAKQWHTFNQDTDVLSLYPGDYVVFNDGTAQKPQNRLGLFWRWDGGHMWCIEWVVEKDAGKCVIREHPADPLVIVGWIAWQGQRLVRS